MMKGYVNRNLEPVVTIEMENHQGDLQSFEAVLDTAFNGEIALPVQMIEFLGLSSRGQALAWTIATGDEVPLAEYDGVVSWHGQSRRVIVVETGDEPLLGTSLLSGSRISIDMRGGGEVLIEEDWPTR